MLIMFKKTSGFTLLEILIALFIFAILSLILAQGLHLIVDIQTRTAQKAERLRTVQMALLIISRDLEQTINRPISNSKGLEEAAFIGTPRVITFTHLGGANGQVERVRYQINGQWLERITWSALDQTSSLAEYKRGLLSTLTEAHFQFLDYQGRWHNQWPDEDQKNALPRAVKLFLSFNQWGALSQTYVIPFSPSTPAKTAE